MLLLKQEYTSNFLSEICCMNDENLTLIDGVADLAKLLNYSEEEIKEKSKEGLLGLIEYNYKSESVDINYKDLKKILAKTTASFKVYCKGLDDKNHVIRVKVVLYEKIKKMHQRYFFDGVEYDLGKVLMLMNEMKLVNNSKVNNGLSRWG